jgi:signal transduction histidine kinase
MAMEFCGADLAAIVACAVDEMRPQAQRKHIDLVLTSAGVPRLAVDPTRIAQLLGNLLSTATSAAEARSRSAFRSASRRKFAIAAVLA